MFSDLITKIFLLSYIIWSNAIIWLINWLISRALAADSIWRQKNIYNKMPLT